IIASDSMWRGPITLNSSSTISVSPSSRLILSGAIDDASNTLAAGSDLTKVAGGELVLSGSNTYRGNTYAGAGPTAGPTADPAVPGVQSVQVYGTSGTFTLTFNNKSTPALPFGDSAADVQAKLNALSTIGGVGGSVTVTKTGSFYYVVFGG